MVLIGNGGTPPEVKPPAPGPDKPEQAPQAEPATGQGPEQPAAPVEPPQPVTPPADPVQPAAPLSAEEPTSEEARRGALLRRRALIAMVVIVVLIGASAGAIVLGRHSGAHATTPPKATTAAPAHFVTYRDPAEGFSISYPKTWTRVVPPGNGLALLLNAGGDDAVSVRVFGTQSPVKTAKDLAAIKSVTDGILGQAGTTIQVLKQQSFTLNGMPGYYYLYTFPGTNGASGGVHAQYFVFQGRAMNELLFQAVPASDFARLAPVFDQVANTFHSTPGFIPPPPTTTVPSSTVPATTAPG